MADLKKGLKRASREKEEDSVKRGSAPWNPKEQHEKLLYPPPKKQIGRAVVAAGSALHGHVPFQARHVGVHAPHTNMRLPSHTRPRLDLEMCT